MSDSKLVLHAGPHKTGSTYLQYRLTKARGALQEQNWEYPKYGILQFNQQRVYAWLAGDTATAGDVDEASFKELLANHARLILSSEDFVNLPRSTLLKLKALLKGFEIQIVLYVRTPVDLWPSHWQELIRHGRDITLLEYLGAQAGWNNIMPAGAMNPYAQAIKFANVFGKESLRIFCYDNMMREGADIFAHFWSNILGLQAPVPYEPPKTINPSQPADKIEMLRNLNQLYIERHRAPAQMKVLKAYQKAQAEVDALPHYDAFKKGFAEHAATVTLSSNQEIFRNRERMLMNNFKMRIENKASEDVLFQQESFERKFSFGERYWVDRFGFRTFVEQIFDKLQFP
jgi:hypothetical protein